MRSLTCAAALAAMCSACPTAAVPVPIDSTAVDLVDGPFDASGSLLASAEHDLTFLDDGGGELGTATVTSRVFRQSGGNMLFQYLVHDVNFPGLDASQWNLVSVGVRDFGTFETDVRGGTGGLVAARAAGDLTVGTTDVIHNDHNLQVRTDALNFEQGGELSVSVTIDAAGFDSGDGQVSGVYLPSEGVVIPLPPATPAGLAALALIAGAGAWSRRRRSSASATR